jgi:RhtB (resistance to homoserine/threonine) family protein
METFWADWVTVFVVTGLASVSPGPNFAIVVKNSLVHSRRAGVWTAGGVTAGNLPHIVFGLVGVTVVVSQSVLLFNTLKWLGAAYLIYLGVRSLLAKRQDSADNPATLGGANGRDDMASTRAFWNSFLISVLNPKVALFYLVLFTQAVRPDTPAWAHGVYALTVIAMTFGWHALLALFASQTAVRTRFQAAMHWVERVTGAVLIVLGVRLAFTRSNG